MLAVEFNDPNDPVCKMHATEGKAVPKDIHNRVQKKCFEQGLMVLTTSIYPVCSRQLHKCAVSVADLPIVLSGRSLHPCSHRQ